MGKGRAASDRLSLVRANAQAHLHFAAEIRLDLSAGFCSQGTGSEPELAHYQKLFFWRIS